MLTAPRVNKVDATPHSTKAFDLHFIMNTPVLLKMRPEVIMNGLKLICMKIEHLVFRVSVSFLPCSLSKLVDPFALTVSKS